MGLDPVMGKAANYHSECVRVNAIRSIYVFSYLFTSIFIYLFIYILSHLFIKNCIYFIKKGIYLTSFNDVDSDGRFPLTKWNRSRLFMFLFFTAYV